jgi:outer membrane protein OmpA-like peptidoglycan-associated protein
MKKLIILIQTVGLLSLSTMAVATEPGPDHPLVSRFSGAEMLAHQQREYDAVSLPVDPVPRGAHRNRDMLREIEVSLEGRVSWIAYRAPENRSALEIFRNYQQALLADGFSLRFECAGADGCGPGMGYHVTNNVLPHNFIGGTLSFDVQRMLGNPRAMLVVRNNEEGVDHVFLYISDERRPVILQVVVAGMPMQTGLVETGVRSADELQESLTAEGKAIVEGIFFEHDSAELRDESRDALIQMAELLKTNPEIQVLVVGHTDNQGSFEYNEDLSRRRANAVHQALVRDYGIASERMSAKGASFMAPIASNASEEGRALNRRVELVLK